MKLMIDIEKDYYEILKFNIENGQKYKPWEIIANGIPYEEKPQGEWIGIKTSCDIGHKFYYCSVCSREIDLFDSETLEDYPFCHCGAKMKERKDIESST